MTFLLRRILRIKKSETQNYIDVSELESGLHFIQIQTTLGTTARRFIKR